MERARIRRRRIFALAALVGLGAAAFAGGMTLGDGSGPEDEAKAKEPLVATKLPLGRLAGERIVVGLESTSVPGELRKAIHQGALAGVVLFSASFPSRETGRKLIAKLQSIPRPRYLRDPLLIMVDQEGGQVKRVSGPPSVSAATMGERGAAFSRKQGRLTAKSLRGVGVNVDLAPVLDVAARPGGTIAETERGFGSSAAAVAATAIPFAQGLQAGGVAATAKHFPGLGAAAENTDFAVQQVDLSKAKLRKVDEAPYRRFVPFGDLVMLSTAIYPAFSPQPAAFSRAIATGELRDRLGFAGVSITDALETVAVEDFGGPAKAGVAAARAGTDLLLFADLAGAQSARRALVGRLRRGALDRHEFVLSAQRVLDLRANLAP